MLSIASPTIIRKLRHINHTLHKVERILYSNNASHSVCIQPSILSMQTVNPIRVIWDNLSNYKIANHKEYISIALGDPTKYMDPPLSIKNAILNAYNSPNTINSYCNSSGLESARIAISAQYKNCSPDNVFITGGGQGALDLSFASLLNGNNLDNILLPSPGWPEYATGLDRHNISYKYYKCLPNKQWQIDINNLESLIDINTRGIVTNSPSNPCGSILTYDNMLNVLKIAHKYKLPVISDEIYSNIIFPNDNNNKFVSYLTIKEEEKISVPIIITSGLAKNYLIPGWKVGWIVIDDDDNNSLDMIKIGISKLLQVNFGPSSLCQSMIKDILENTSSDYWNTLNKQLYEQSKLFSDLINDTIPELTAIPGSGAFYMMIKIHIDKLKDIKNDTQFFEKLLEEQAVFILPGSIFKMDNYFRAVICASNDVLIEVVDRLREFCTQHRAN